MKEQLKLTNVSYEVKDLTIFNHIHASVQQGDIIGIIGKNGAGKSTLLHLINKDLTPSQGQIQWMQHGLKTVLVEQETESFSFENQTPAEVKLLKKWRVPARDFSQLSGGEKLKARLAKGLSEDADLFLLDEPTNHLDDISLQFLIQQLKNVSGTVILVSHDRYFLDEVATKIWSIEGHTLTEYKGNYSGYMKFRKEERLAQQREYEKQQKMIERIEAQMTELTSWSKKAHAQSTKKEGFKEYHRVKAKRTDAQIKSKQKRLEKELEKTKAEPVDPEYTVRFSIDTAHKTGKRFLEVQNLTKSFGEKTLFQNARFTIQHGEKVAITGPNGSGKTTLLKVILGQETAEGKVWISPSAKIGYLTQEVFDLPLAQTPEELFYQDTFKARGNVQTIMTQLGFAASQWTEPIQHMSMGERVKCKLMAYILEEKDVLILDEPTNHLDLPSREQLEETLSQYSGTLIVVSHDRYFLEKTTSSTLVISDNGIEKQLKDVPSERNDREELRLKLETERQEVLGKLSFMTPNDKGYKELDQAFNELTKRMKELD
ncbi:ABC-F type ribosomal protection protein [Bacillus mojavensis]|uniref:ribosomal protection-like ABC-F family protein n=1 Tax=Bacillus mojavensis TaxID=72360 RepID=UPI002DB56B72|nr:ABC-F type ribosomal protection protein [Bacillus mojavensis]MEC1613458.1 ABC-F type ribosomal protection protein [Bacillus mojavensis]MEC1690476.1 ABC-F type ribosomal protection protein [Bacillus mojavensis]